MPQLKWLEIADTSSDPRAANVVLESLDVALDPFRAAIQEHRLPGRISTAVFYAWTEDRHDVLVHVVDDGKPQDHESLVVLAPPAVSDLSSTDRAWLAAETAHAALTRLAVALGWDAAVTADMLDAARNEATAGLPTPSETLPVRAQGRGRHAPDQPHELTFMGGWPVGGGVGRHFEALGWLCDQLEGPAWQEWWSRSPLPLCEIWVAYEGSKVGFRVRADRYANATIVRPAATVNSERPEDQARADLAALMERIAARLELPDPPPLRTDLRTENA